MANQPLDLDKVSKITLGHYNGRADKFREGTQHHDVSQNINALLEHIDAAPLFTIPDFGCGPGRDLKTFEDLGHTVIGLDGSSEFVKMAWELGFEVWEQNFLELHLPYDRFDGVFANASLFHVPGKELPHVLRQLRASLKPGGVLFSSNPRGDNREGWNGERCAAYHELEAWRGYLVGAGFTEIEHYYPLKACPGINSHGWQVIGVNLRAQDEIQAFYQRKPTSPGLPLLVLGSSRPSFICSHRDPGRHPGLGFSDLDIASGRAGSGLHLPP